MSVTCLNALAFLYFAWNYTENLSINELIWLMFFVNFDQLFLDLMKNSY